MSINGLKANPDKCHLILSESSTEYFVKVANFTIPNSQSKNLLGITIDSKLSFDVHVGELCNKASQKLHALSRISHFMDIKQRQIIMKAFINFTIWLLLAGLDVSW